MRTGDIARLLGVCNRTVRNYYTTGQLTTSTDPVRDLMTLVAFAQERGALD